MDVWPGLLVLVASFGIGGVILRPFLAQRRKAAEDYMVAGMAMILVFPFLVFIAARTFKLYVDAPLVLSLGLILGMVGLFYRFKRAR